MSEAGDDDGEAQKASSNKSIAVKGVAVVSGEYIFITL